MAAAFYAALLETKLCLEAAGYEIAEAPSFDVFFESIQTAPWHPYASLPRDIAEAEWARINDLCPQP